MEGNLLITLLPTIVVALPTLIALVAADVRFCQPGGDLRGGKRSQDQSKEERVHCWFDQSSNDPFALNVLLLSGDKVPPQYKPNLPLLASHRKTCLLGHLLSWTPS